jgi:hypothetical protein
MLACALDDDRLSAFGRQTDETFAEAKLHATDRLLEQTHRGAEAEALEVGARQQVQGADVRVESLGHQVDDVAQRLVQVVGP